MELVEFSDRSLDVGSSGTPAVHQQLYIYNTGTGENRAVNGWMDG